MRVLPFPPATVLVLFGRSRWPRFISSWPTMYKVSRNLKVKGELDKTATPISLHSQDIYTSSPGTIDKYSQSIVYFDSINRVSLHGFHGRRLRVYTHRSWNARRYLVVFVVCSYSALYVFLLPILPNHLDPVSLPLSSQPLLPLSYS